MTMLAIDVDQVSRISGDEEVRELATAASEALCRDLESLTSEQWDTVTVCNPWTVADIARHVLGAMEGQVSFRESIRQQAHGIRHRKRFDGNVMDAFNAFQIANRRHLDGAMAAEAIGRLAGTAATARVRMARRVGPISIPLDQGGSTARGMPSKMALSELYRVIYTRDSWLHRLDVADALGRAAHLDTAADRRIVEDVVKEWATRHGKPFDLRLRGAFEVRYRRGEGGPVIETTPDRLCWMLSGRAEPEVGAPGADLLNVRVLF